tara:strand:- start:3609 stop:5654 length:2046 start_codon:yes stop_codon:yes gene_type:complete
MCGIVGIFNQENAQSKVQIALAQLQNRGKDDSGIIEVENGFLGHNLHAIVGHVKQPLVGEGVLVANCEIYNWKELNRTYNFNAQNDAEFLLKFLDTFGYEKLGELQGVYAFAYHKNGKVILARDIIGVKPLWFSYTTDGFSFASERKVLSNAQELNPRHFLTYDVTDNSLSTNYGDFFTYLPGHGENEKELKKQTQRLLDSAIKKRIPNQTFGLLFSGGIDSTYIARYLKKNGHEFTCYTAVLDTDTVIPSDLEAAQKVAVELGLNLKVKKVKIEDIPKYLEKIVPLIEDSNVVKVGVALTFYIACEMAKEDGCKVIFSGLGSEEIFAGYERHKNSANINQECVSGLLKMYERDLYRDDVITMENNLELRLPFLDHSLVDYALKIPATLKIDGMTKKILRTIALEKGIPQEFAFRKKVAAQYGSRFDNAIGKLAKREGLLKSAYLRQFYPSHNLKLGVLFSSGKDSTSAALIMKKQNYELACLITMRSANKESYMFQSAGVELVELQAEAMNVPLIVQDTLGEKEEELKDLEKAIIHAKEEFQIDGIVSGALFSVYQRDRIEKICDKLGLKIFSPLWHKPQKQHMREVVDNGFEVVLTAIAGEGLNKSWLNRRITHKDLIALRELGRKIKFNQAGEGGEFESLVLDCPLFSKKIVLEDVDIVEENECTAHMVVKKAVLVDK